MSTDNGTENGRTRVFIYGALVAIVAIGVLGVVFKPEQAILTLGFCGLGVTGLFTHLSSVRTSEKQAERQEKKLEVVAQKAEEVKTTLIQADAKNDAKLDKIDNSIEEVYHLSNSAHRVQLKLNADLSRHIAHIEPGEQTEKVAVAAEKLLADHDAAQAAADAKKAESVQKVEVVSPEVQKVEVVIVERKDT